MIIIKDNNQNSTNFNDVSILSFFPNKVITTGEGGMLLTNDKRVASKVEMLRNSGITRNNKLFKVKNREAWYYEQQLLGFNYRMTEISGAFGKVQLGKFSSILKESKKRYLTFERYISHNQIKLRHVNLGNEPNYDTFVISIENKNLRNRVISLLNQTGFGTKNLPDAFNWHCAYFWEHIDKNIRNKEVKSCYDRLLKCVAIPILVSRSIIDYKNIASYINELS